MRGVADDQHPVGVPAPDAGQVVGVGDEHPPGRADDVGRDAVVLAKALREEPDPALAAARYERARRGRTQANIVASAGMSGHPITDADPGEALPDAVLHAQLDWTARLP